MKAKNTPAPETTTPHRRGRPAIIRPGDAARDKTAELADLRAQYDQVRMDMPATDELARRAGLWPRSFHAVMDNERDCSFAFLDRIYPVFQGFSYDPLCEVASVETIKWGSAGLAPKDKKAAGKPCRFSKNTNKPRH